MGTMRQNAEEEIERKQCDHAFWHDDGHHYCPRCGANLGPTAREAASKRLTQGESHDRRNVEASQRDV